MLIRAQRTDVVCDNDIKVEGQGCPGTECSYTTETELVFKLGCYKFKMLILTLKKTKKKFKNIQKIRESKWYIKRNQQNTKKALLQGLKNNKK